MKSLIIGSRALAHHLDINRIPSDLDYICDYEFFKQTVSFHKSINNVFCCYPLSDNKYVLKTKDSAIIEFEIAWDNNSSSDLILDVEQGNASLEMLYMLKMSHRYRKDNPHFLKTMEDIHFLRKNGINKIPCYLQDIYEIRQEETYNYSHPSLKQSKKDFFSGDGIEYKYDHDTIHLAVSELFLPAYTYIKENIKEVEVSKELFYKQHWRTQLLTVVEEAMVLALERSIIPYPEAKTPEEAFEYALMKVCTSITSGWWREYAWENYYEAKGYFYYKRKNGWKYEEAFKQALENGVVKEFKEEK